MSRLRLLTLLLALLGAPLGVWGGAQADGQGATGFVVLVQRDAWLERSGVIRRLERGMTVQAGDLLRTGNEARLVVRFPEGSTLKLGEYAELRVAGLAAPAEPGGGLLEAALEVVKGAFRYTAETLGPRDVRVRVNTITIGIRGTDLWGKAGHDKDIACLLKGRIEVAAKGVQHLLDTPGQGFVVPRDQAPMPVSLIPPAQIADWATQTEPQGVLE
jgi:hypothetical protein